MVIAVVRDGPPDPLNVDSANKRLAAFGGLSHAIFVAIMILMIWKPGA